MMSDWPDHPYNYTPARYLHWINQFPLDLADSAASDHRRGRAMTNVTWRIAAEQALIVEFDSHDRLWSVTNMWPFYVSMDYLSAPVQVICLLARRCARLTC
jgi:hypothetical protein